MTTTKPSRKLRVVDDDPKPARRSRRWKSDAERRKLPVVNVRGEQGAPPLPQQGHEALERLLGKRVKGD